MNRVFGVTAIAVAGWSLTNALFQVAAEKSMATLWAQLSYVSALVLGASFLHFAWVYPQNSHISVRAKQALWVVAAVVSFSSFIPGFVIRSVSLSGNRSIQTNAGVYLIALFMLVTSAWAFGLFLRHRATLAGLARAQSLYVLTGSAITAIVGLTSNLALPLAGNYSWVWLGPLSSLTFVGGTVYSIVAHHLFDIRIIIKRTVVYGLLLSAIGAGYTIVEYALTEALQHATGSSSSSWIANIGGAVAVSFCVHPLREWLEKKVHRLVFGRTHHRHRISQR